MPEQPTMQSDPDDELLSLATAGDLLWGVSVWTVRRWVRRGVLTPVYIGQGGKRLRVKRSEVDALRLSGFPEGERPA